MQIELSELRELFDAVVSEMEDGGQSAVNLDLGYYWEVPPGDRYEIYEEPKELTIGDLEYDWERLRSVLEGRDVPIRYSLVWLSALLRAIGEKQIKRSEK